MKVILTGSTGFIGQEGLSQCLKRAFENAEIQGRWLILDSSVFVMGNDGVIEAVCGPHMVTNLWGVEVDDYVRHPIAWTLASRRKSGP